MEKNGTTATPMEAGTFAELPPPSMPKKLEALFQDIQVAYTAELEELEKLKDHGVDGDIREAFTRSRTAFKPIRELLGKEKKQKAPRIPENATQDSPTATTTGTVSNATQKLDVIQAWENLVLAMSELAVFLEYVVSLEDAFREIAEKPSMLAPEAAYDEREAVVAASWFRQQLNLANLMTHTVKNHHRDASTECRFVTILEIALSYQKPVTSNEGDSKIVYQWRPSDNLQRFWVRLQQPMDPNMSPFDFRRKAYGVLVSLSWVPSSKGLLQACSIPDSSPSQLSSEAPLEARRILGKIAGRPLPRNDSVYQVLDRLKDETNVSVVIAASKYNKVSSLGIGKTTVAALVAVHPLILRCFKVLWLNMDYNKKPVLSSLREKSSQRQGQEKLKYGTYIKYLDSLCQQLGCDAEGGSSSSLKRPEWPEDHSLKRLEEPAIRHRREQNLMRKAQLMMSNVLEETGRNILLILDDAKEVDDLTWFQFTEKQSVLATSPSPMSGVDFSVDLDPWGEEESIELFLLEADCSQSRGLASASELKNIVKLSHFHPVIVRTAARLFKLKRVTSGVIQALEEANLEFNPVSLSRVPSTGTFLTATEEDTSTQRQLSRAESIRSTTNSMDTSVNSVTEKTSLPVVPRALKNMLDTILSPMVKELQQPSKLFKLCLASFAAVFSEFQPVPLTAALLLWEQLFTMEPDALVECGGDPSEVEIKKRVWFIAEGLTHMGLLSFTEDVSGEAFVAIHHSLYTHYALDIMSDMSIGDRPEEIFMQWHKAFVAAYLTRKFEGDNCDSCHEYALEKLSTHMIYCTLHVKAVALLSNGRLYQERISAFGRDRATTMHVEDCILLMQHIQGDPTIPREQREEITSKHFQKIAALLAANVNTSQEQSALELAKDLYAIGFGLAENKKFKEALDLYTQAQALVPKSDSFAATILYGLGSVNLILNEPGKAIKSFMGSIACMTILGEDGDVAGKARHTLYLEVSRLQGESSMAQCNYKMALTQFEETLERMNDDSFESEIEYGILMNRKGRLHQVMGDLEMATTEIKKCIKWKEKMREQSRDLAAAHSTLADVYTAMDMIKDARRHIDFSLKTLQSVETQWPKLRYDDEEREIDIQTLLLTAKHRTLRPDMPVHWEDFEIIREKLLKSPVLLMDQSGYDLRCMARAYIAAGEHDTAVSIIEDTLRLLSDRPDSLERALCLIDLGTSFMDQGEAYDDNEKAKTMFELALKLFGLALKIQRPKLGDCQQVLETLDAIGNLHVHLQMHEVAITIYAEALVLARKLRSEADKIAGILFFLGECHEALGNLEDATIQYEECVQALRIDRMPDDLDLARPLKRLAAISLQQTKFSRAKEIYEEILKIREANFDHDDVILAETNDILGSVERKRLDYSSACAYHRKALEIRMLHEDARAIGNTIYQIGYALRMQLDFANALSNLEQSLASIQSIVDHDSLLLAKVLLAIGDTYFALGQLDSAENYCQRAFTIRIKALGPDHPKTGNASRSLGLANVFLNKNVSEAAILLQEYIRIMDIQLLMQLEDRKPIEYIAVMIILSDIQVAHDRRKLAGKILSTAREYCADVQDDAKKDPAKIGQLKLAEELRNMIDVRRSFPMAISSSSLSGPEGPKRLEHSPDEVKIFQSIPWTDAAP